MSFMAISLIIDRIQGIQAGYNDLFLVVLRLEIGDKLRLIRRIAFGSNC
jgi:hypothetical protein